MADIDAPHPWYAIRIRGRHERVIAAALNQKGYEIFLPLHVSRRRWSDRMQSVEAPLFPGYLFCRLDVGNRLPLLVTPGVLQVVGIGKSLVPVEDAEIAAVQAIVISRLEAEPYPYTCAGQAVRIERGPLGGLEGIVLEAAGSCRLVVSVTLLQRSVAVEIDRDWVAIVEKPRGRETAAPLRAPASVPPAPHVARSSSPRHDWRAAAR